jgi:hypothetical protein
MPDSFVHLTFRLLNCFVPCEDDGNMLRLCNCEVRNRKQSMRVCRMAAFLADDGAGGLLKPFFPRFTLLKCSVIL